MAISQVDMPSAAAAKQCKVVVDKDGTGNVTELSRESAPYRSVRYTGRLYTSGLDGTTIRNTQIQPVGWWPGDVALNEIRKGAGL